MKIRRVVPNLRGTKMPESRAFYVDVIGLELAMDLGWIMSFSSKDNPTAQLSVLTKDATAPTHPDVSIEVDDLDAVHARAVASGAEIVHPPTIEPWGVRRFFVRDPNGAVINVREAFRSRRLAQSGWIAAPRGHVVPPRWRRRRREQRPGTNQRSEPRG